MSTPSYERELERILQALQRAEEERQEDLEDYGDTTEELETVDASEEKPSKDLPEVVSRVTAKTLFSHPDAHPLVLDLALLAKFGPEWFLWEPETVQAAITEELGPLSDLNLAKVMAVRTLHLTSDFWKEWHVFVWCAMPLNDTFPDFDVMQVPSAAQVTVAAYIAGRVRADLDYSAEMKKYLEVVHLHDGVFVPQAPLDFLEVAAADYPVNLDDVKRRWPLVRTANRAPTGSTVEDEQLRRMLEIRHHLLESQSRLRAQLPLVQPHA